MWDFAYEANAKTRGRRSQGTLKAPQIWAGTRILLGIVLRQSLTLPSRKGRVRDRVETAGAAAIRWVIPGGDEDETALSFLDLEWERVECLFWDGMGLDGG